MQTIPTEIAIKRYDSLPPKLQETAASITTGRLVWAIGKAHNLDEDKISRVLTLVAAVLFGFIHVEELDKRIREETGLHPETTKAVAEEIDLRIFSPLRPLLHEIYEPVTPEGEEKNNARTIETPEKKTISLEEISGELPKEKEIPITAAEAPEATEEKPLILSEEKPLFEEKERPMTKGFSFPFGLFKKKEEEPLDAAQDKPVKVKIETPFGATEDKPERVVHYSELRTPVSALGKEEDIINLETLQPFGSTQAEVPKIEKTLPVEPPLPPDEQNKPDNPILREVMEKTETATGEPVKADSTTAKTPFWKKFLRKSESPIQTKIEIKNGDSADKKNSWPAKLFGGKSNEALNQNDRQNEKADGPEVEGNIVNLTNNK